MISLYLDRELPSPWKEKMDAHLRECPVCEEKLTRFRDLTEHSADCNEVSRAKERVWLRLNVPQIATKFPAQRRASSVWNRSVSAPLPLVIAAAAALIMAFGFFFVRSSPRETSPDQAVAAVDMTTIVPVSDLSGVLQFLGDESSPDIVIIRLPESRSFMSSGQPAIIRAADYSGGKRSR